MKTLRFFILMLAIVFSGTLTAQSQKELGELMRNRGEYYFTLNVENQSEIKALCQLCSVDKTDGRTVVCYANQREYDNLLKMGYQPTLETPPSLREEAKMWDGNRDTYDWNSYPTYSQLEQMMQGFSSTTVSGRFCTYLELGTLSSGRKVMGVRINNGQTEGKPKFLYSSTIHGDETTGMILLLRLIEELCTSTDSRIVRLVDSLDIFIFPDANPDGTYYGGNNTVTGSRRANGNNVDMNRNYPDPHSSQHPDGNAWQSETQWFMQLAEDYPFVMAANFHGGAEVMNYPWDNTSTRHADDAWWQYISREYVTNTRTVYSSYMTDTYSSGITNGADWYTIGGGRQDYMNGYRQCREITIECSSDKTLAASQLNTYWNYNHTAMLAFMEQCLNGVHGKVVDANTNQVLDGVTVTVLNHDDEYSIVSTHEDGYYHRPIKGGSYSFKFTKDGYCSQTLDVTINDDQKVDLDVYLYPAGDCPVVLDCYNPATNIAAGSYIMGHLDGTNLITPSHNSSSTVTTTTTEVTTTDNGFSVEEETNIPQVTLYGSNGQYYIYYNGRYLARSSNGSGLTWGTSQSSSGRWYINSNGIYVAVSSGGGWGGSSNTTNYYLYYSNGSFRISTTSQNNITFYTEGDCPVTEHTITAIVEPYEGGTVTGAGTYDDGATCTLVATANPTYSFVSWTENDEEVSTEATYSFTVTSDRNLVAQFIMNTYFITATAEPSEGGSVTGSGTYMEGETCTLRATPREGYSFVSFSIGDETITDNPYSFNVHSDMTVTANFQLNSYEVIVISNPEFGGLFDGYGTYNHGDIATVTTTPLPGYVFINWTIDGYEVSTDFEYSFTVTEDVEVVANYEALEYTVSVVMDEYFESYGTVEGAGTYTYGETATIEAWSNTEGIIFTGFFINGEEVSGSPYSFEVTEDVEIFAKFEIMTFGVTAFEVEPENSGAVTGDGIYLYGEEVTLEAYPEEGYSFVSFTFGDETITDNPYIFNIFTDMEVITHFQLNSYEVTATANPAEGGIVTGAGTYNHGETATLTATANSGYEFVNWTIDNEVVSSNAEYSFIVTEPVEIVANFELSADSQEFSLATGWSWWSTYIEMNSVDGLQLLENALGDNATQIKSQNRFLLYENNVWDGNLTALTNEQMYRLYTVADGGYTIAGSYADPADHTINLRQGWNWIGYVENTVMEPNTALANLTTAAENDCLKSYTDFATYYEGYGWYGESMTMEPGQGYMLRVANRGSFTYASNDKGTVVNNNHSNVNKYWKPVIGKFPDNMNVLAVIELNGNELRTEEAELAAFDETGECRGSALLRYVEPINRYVAFLTVYGENEEALNLRVRYEGMTYNVNEQITMMADEVIGKGTEPYKMTVRGAGLDEINANLNLYPNPVGQGQEVKIELPENMGNATIEVIDMMGRIISRNVVDGGDGACTVSTPDMPGVYTIRVIDEQGQTWNGKLIIK